MKKILFSLILVLLTSIVVSCSDDVTNQILLGGLPTYVQPGTTNSNGEYAITFGSYTPSSRAIANGGISQLGYDEFKLFAWNSDNAIMNPFLVRAIGANQYAYVGINNQDTLFFKNAYNEYKFIGILPTTLSMVKNGESVDVSDVEAFCVDNEASTDTPKEFLYAKTTVAKANYKDAVQLNFKHGNAKVYLRFTSDDDNTTLISTFNEEVDAIKAVIDQLTTLEGKYNGMAEAAITQTTV